MQPETILFGGRLVTFSPTEVIVISLVAFVLLCIVFPVLMWRHYKAPDSPEKTRTTRNVVVILTVLLMLISIYRRTGGEIFSFNDVFGLVTAVIVAFFAIRAAWKTKQ